MRAANEPHQNGKKRKCTFRMTLILTNHVQLYEVNAKSVSENTHFYSFKLGKPTKSILF